MDKIDMLWVRACKSKEPKVRLTSVYRRFYCGYIEDDSHIPHVTRILAEICEKYNLFTIIEFIDKINEKFWLDQLFDVDTHFTDKVFQVMVDKIRHTEPKKVFPELTSPRRFCSMGKRKNLTAA